MKALISKSSDENSSQSCRKKKRKRKYIILRKGYSYSHVNLSWNVILNCIQLILVVRDSTCVTIAKYLICIHQLFPANKKLIIRKQLPVWYNCHHAKFYYQIIDWDDLFSLGKEGHGLNSWIYETATQFAPAWQHSMLQKRKLFNTWGLLKLHILNDLV